MGETFLEMGLLPKLLTEKNDFSLLDSLIPVSLLMSISFLWYTSEFCLFPPNSAGNWGHNFINVLSRSSTSSSSSCLTNTEEVSWGCKMEMSSSGVGVGFLMTVSTSH